MARTQPAVPEEASLLGSSIGRIRLVDRLGKGGMGEVFVGYDQTLDRRVAVKCVRVAGQPDKIKGRFLQEARILSRLDHPNICQIYDFVESDDSDYLVMELVEGESLKQAAERGLDDKAKLKIAQDTADVLVAAHAEGVVHRDLKPEHVMITTDGQVKILDFGVAHSIETPGDTTLDLSAGLGETPVPPAYHTVAGSLVGTPGYMSPEQARGEPVTPASDMYTFGLLLQELFTGERAYPRQPLATLLSEVAAGRSRPVVGLGRKLTELIEELKEPRPSDRPTAKEAADRIRWIRETPMRWLRRAAAAAAVVLLAAGVSKYAIDLARERSAAIAARDQAEDLVGFMLEDLSDELRPAGRLQILEQVARKALDYYERAGPKADDEAAFRRGSAFRIVSEVLDDRGDRQAAFEAAKTGLAIHRRLVEANPDRLDWRNQLALDHLALGGILRLSGEHRHAAARQALETARGMASELVELEPERAEWRQTLGETFYGLGMYQLFSAGDVEQARRSFDQALAVYQRLAEEDPSSHHFKFRLAVLHGQGLGQTYDQLGMEKESFAAIERAYALYQGLTRADPANTRWQNGFAWENRRLGDAYASQGKLEEALAHYEEALQIGRLLLSLDPANIDWQQGLADDHSSIGSLHEQRGDLTAALTSFETSIEIYEHLHEIEPADRDLRRWLAGDHEAAGEILRRLGRAAEAAEAWRRCAELLAPDAGAPDGVASQVLETYAVALLRLGRAGEARPAVEALRRRGWFEGDAGAELIELCRGQGWVI